MAIKPQNGRRRPRSPRLVSRWLDWDSWRPRRSPIGRI